MLKLKTGVLRFFRPQTFPRFEAIDFCDCMISQNMALPQSFRSSCHGGVVCFEFLELLRRTMLQSWLEKVVRNISDCSDALDVFAKNDLALF